MCVKKRDSIRFLECRLGERQELHDGLVVPHGGEETAQSPASQVASVAAPLGRGEDNEWTRGKVSVGHGVGPNERVIPRVKEHARRSDVLNTTTQ